MRNHSKIAYSHLFDKQLKNAPLKIKEAFRKRREIFEKDPFHPQLSNHPLSGKMKGHRSINITGDWRMIYSETDKKDKKVILFELLGTHSQLYR